MTEGKIKLSNLAGRVEEVDDTPFNRTLAVVHQLAMEPGNKERFYLKNMYRSLRDMDRDGGLTEEQRQYIVDTFVDDLLAEYLKQRDSPIFKPLLV